jgi:hypothetical protein
VTGRRGRICRKLLDDLKERRGYSHLKEEALHRTMWRAGFGRSFGSVMRQTAKRMNIINPTGWFAKRRVLLNCCTWYCIVLYCLYGREENGRIADSPVCVPRESFHISLH